MTGVQTCALPIYAEFNSFLQAAREAQKTSQGNFVDLFYSAFKEKKSGQKLSTYFASAKGSITASDDDQTVLNKIRAEVDDAINRSFTILKTRIDQFGTSSPNIQKLPATGRIQIEIPGADNPQRVRKLLQGVARLEFWSVVELSDPSLMASLEGINSLLLKERAQQAEAAKASAKTPQADASDKKLSVLEEQLKKAKDSSGTVLDSIRKIGRAHV